MITITKDRVYLVAVLVLLVVILSNKGGEQTFVEIIAHIGLVMFFLFFILLAFAVFTPDLGGLLDTKGFIGYFKFLAIIALIAVPIIFSSNFLGQTVLESTSEEDTGSITGSSIAKLVFNSDILRFALVVFIGLLLLGFTLLFLGE